MNGWLRPIPLKLANLGPSLSGLGARAWDTRDPQAFLGQIRLQQPHQLERPVAHLDQGPKCCNAPDGTTKCFDHSTGECINTWNKDTPTAGAKACVRNSEGDWVHPDCYTPPPPKMNGRIRRIPISNLGAGSVSDTSGQPPSSAAAAPQKLIACINGPDLYDIYNPDMSLVARRVLDPNASYPGAQIDFAKFPPCPVPQSTGVGGLCDLPNEYLAPADPSGPPAKSVLVCYGNNGVTLFDYVTGAVIATHLSSACLSLLSNATIAQAGDPRCSGGAGPATPATSTPPSGGGQVTTPPSPGPSTAPPSGDQVTGSAGQGTVSPGSGDQGTSALSPGGEVLPVSGSEPIPATGVPVLPAPQQFSTASAPTGAFPGQPFSATQQPVPLAKAPAPLPPPCPLGPVPLRKWVEGCMGS